MKRTVDFYWVHLTYIFLGVLLILIMGCKKTNKIILPQLSTTALTNINVPLERATSGGTIINDGGGLIYSRGVCWNTTGNPTTVLNTKTIDGAGTGSFSSTIIGINGGATYYIRAYANNDAGTAYGNEITLSLPITIGQEYQSGIVFYIDGTGLHGLVAEVYPGSLAYVWYNGNYILTNASSLTDGSLNTTTIINAQGSTPGFFYAAKECRYFGLGGYTDWFLPSKDQLNKLYLQKAAVPGLENNVFWSSTELDSQQAWTQSFGNGAQSTASKNVVNLVRPIRAF